ncbi:MAG: hypothetical protein MJ119_01225 [Lachnospiraceae bacterium]|nr:hypothetical protein [Lachnospiraceae bacterium]
MKLSDRDTKLIVILLIVLVIVLPYLLVVRKYDTKSEEIQTNIKALEERRNYLSQLDIHRQEYLDNIALLETERTKLIQDYACGIEQENTLMFIRNAELKYMKEDGDPLGASWIGSIDFEDIIDIPISEDSVDEEGNIVEGLTAHQYTTTIGYSTSYDSIKAFVDYILGNAEKMNVSALSIKKDSEVGYVTGALVLNQYAITGEGREFKPLEMPKLNHPGNPDPFASLVSDKEEKAQAIENMIGNDDEEEDED